MGHGGGDHGYAAERAAMTERGRPGTPVPGRYGPGNCCLHVAAGLLVLFVLVAGGIAWSVHRAMNPPGPDLEALAAAPEARAADRAVTRSMDGQLAALRAATPWAEELGTSATDYCYASLGSAFVTFSRSWTSVGCTRETAVYVAFDGDLQQRLRQLDAAVAGLAGLPAGSTARQPHSLEQQLASRSATPNAGADPAGSSPAPSTGDGDAPIRLSVRYAVPYSAGRPAPTGPPATAGASAAPTAPHPAGHGESVTVDVSVATRPAAPDSATWDGAWSAEGHGPADRPYRDGGDERVSYQAWRPLNAVALATAGYAHHRFLASFVLTAHYSTDAMRPEAVRAG